MNVLEWQCRFDRVLGWSEWIGIVMTGKEGYLGNVRAAKLALTRLDELAILPAVAAEAFDPSKTSLIHHYYFE